jgi:16S rRNA (cytosine967-C5)-methyltransferase
MIAPARVAAYDILISLTAGRNELAAALADRRESLRDERDRALAMQIALGVQRWRSALDYLIVHFAKRPIDRLDSEVVEVLRLSAFQLLHLSRVPAAAVVDDGVELARRAGKKSAGGFVNAVLRNISRQRKNLPLPPRPADTGDRAAALDYLSITLSHPRWLTARWYERLGFERTEQWLRFNNSTPPLMLRANPFVTTADKLRNRLAAASVLATPARWAPDGLVIESGNPMLIGDNSSGEFAIQDEASQLVPLLAGAQPGPLVLDTCASPGGKTTALAATLAGAGRVIACDVRPRRVELLRRTVEVLRAPNVSIVQADLLAALPFGDPFDCVLVDAPCSGLGTLRRDPDIKWRRRESDLPVLAAGQRQMLAHAAATVRPGGRVIYATCSSEPEENELVARDFLTASRDFIQVDARTVHAQLPPALVDESGYFRSAPDRHQLEMFFGAVFERRRSP